MPHISANDLKTKGIAAIAETKADLAAGRSTTESVDEHLAWLDQACSN